MYSGCLMTFNKPYLCKYSICSCIMTEARKQHRCKFLYSFIYMVESFKKHFSIISVNFGTIDGRDRAEGLMNASQIQCWSPLTWALNSCEVSCFAEIIVGKFTETICFLSTLLNFKGGK